MINGVQGPFGFYPDVRRIQIIFPTNIFTRIGVNSFTRFECGNF